ncbi:MAG TPA: cache domain-containing protein [Spirochaetota bacterium]|nr:cache domain-containing protein [Spirochaetota bacterium]HOR44857.1 cache domain-containing protein [Spirochaetota bacterium]HPK55515.1 cache domain-containing protein [Spirochaetota bacterium]
MSERINQKPAKFFSKISLQNSIIISSTISVLIPFAFAAVFLYNKLSNDLVNQSKEKSALIANDLATLVDNTLSSELKIISAIAADKHIVNELYSGEYAELEENLSSMFKEMGHDYISFFITDENGVIKVDLPEGVRIGLNLSDRNYFTASKQGKANVSDPIFIRGPSSSKWTGIPMLITAAPIKRNNQFIGMIAITHELSAISSKMNNIKLGKTGYPFIINAEGMAIIHPNQELVMSVNINSEPGMNHISTWLKEKKPLAGNYTFRGTEKIAGFAPLKTKNWFIIFTQNRDEIMKPVNEMLMSIMFIAVIFAGIAVILIVFFSKRISSPIESFVDLLRQFTTYTDEFVIGINADKKIIFANPSAANFFGKTIDELIGTNPIFNITNKASDQKIWQKLDSGLPWTGRISSGINTPNEMIFEITVIQVKDNKGTASGYLEFGRDISNEIVQEKRILQAQKMEAIGTLAGGIAHDFNNILTGIYGYIDLSLLSLDKPDETSKYLKELEKAAKRAGDLVNQILTFSRHSKPELQTVVPKEIAKEVIKLIRATTPAEIGIESKLETDTPIFADPTQIHQVILNLCTNAIHAIGNNHGDIKIAVEDIIIDHVFAENHPGLNQGKHVLISISDSGCGISQDAIDHIFDPFFTTKLNGKGTGLGLSVAHGIIHSIDGIITVYSELKKGTVFNVIIPATDRAHSESEPHGNALMSGSESIMLVDDEQPIANSLASILRSAGYIVTEFTDSQKALENFKNNYNNYDLVITDYSMPKLTGTDLAKEIKHYNASTPVILMSGFVNKNMENSSKELGVDVIVNKPVSAVKLTELMRKILDKNETKR